MLFGPALWCHHHEGDVSKDSFVLIRLEDDRVEPLSRTVRT